VMQLSTVTTQSPSSTRHGLSVGGGKVVLGVVVITSVPV
jgi:hypothetical protein